MSIKRFAARRDANEKPIKQALEAVGATVRQLSEKDIPDLLVGFRGKNYLLEVKTSKGRLTDGQLGMLVHWHGEITVVRSIEQALLAIGATEE